MTKRALISVSDKAGIVEFAQELKKLGWDIISTGGRSCEDSSSKYPRWSPRSS